METNNEERKRLARECFYICYNVPSWKWEQFGKEEHDIWYRIADHIIADRARIVAEQYELSEEELANVINDANEEWYENPDPGTMLKIYIAKSIIQNKSKIFVRKTK